MSSSSRLEQRAEAVGRQQLKGRGRGWEGSESWLVKSQSLEPARPGCEARLLDNVCVVPSSRKGSVKPGSDRGDLECAEVKGVGCGSGPHSPLPLQGQRGTCGGPAWPS